MRRRPKIATVAQLRDNTSEDPHTGAMRSLQAADMTLPEEELRDLWTPMHLERLARTYWRFLARVTLGLVRVLYSESGRSLVLLAPPLELLGFAPPEYELGAGHGVVRWRIERGLLLARAARDANGSPARGHLQIEVRRLADAAPGQARVRVEVEVANFRPALASSLGRRVYNLTQAKIHVFVTSGFLRSLARLDLAESRVGRLAPTPPS